MANVTIEDKFFSDPRVKYLSEISGDSLTATEGKVIRIYKYCIDNEQYLLTKNEINIASFNSDEKFIDNLISSQLIEVVDEENYNIKGVKKRIESKLRRRTNGSKGGKKKAENSWKPTQKDYERVVDYWNNKIAVALNKPSVQVLNDKRKRLIDRMFKIFPNQPETWKMILDEALNTPWIRGGEYTFNFESYFEKERFANLYETARARENKEVKTQNELIDEILPPMQPVMTEEELWENMND